MNKQSKKPSIPPEYAELAKYCQNEGISPSDLINLHREHKKATLTEIKAIGDGLLVVTEDGAREILSSNVIKNRIRELEVNPVPSGSEEDQEAWWRQRERKIRDLKELLLKVY